MAIPKNLRAENRRLSSDLAELGLRLEEAEQALEAICAGQAESLVVQSPDGPRIFSLAGADHSYRVLVEAMNEGAATLGEDGTILYGNARFAKMLDAALDRLIGSAISWFLPERSRGDFAALLHEADGGESRAEVELLSLGGRVVPAYLSVSALHDEGPRRFCLVATDLRAHKRNEEIVAAECLARAVLEQAAEVIVVCDEQGRVIRASRTADQLCGCNPLLQQFDEVFALDLSAHRAPRAGMQKMHPNRVAAEALRGEVLRAAPATLRRPDGSAADVLVSATALRRMEGRIIGCVVNLVDLTERKRVGEALRQANQQLADADRRMNERLAQLAHELGHPPAPPLDEKGTVVQTSPQPPGAAAMKCRVLVIEDNVDAACSLREALELRDHEVEVAHSGPEGLEKARQFDPEFVLCALGLPGMDGFEVARAFRSDEMLKGVHLVAMTGCALPEDVERAAGAGFERHLEKPSTVETIEEILRTMPRPPTASGRNPSRP